MKTTTVVKRWGNSLAIRVPSSVIKSLGLEEDKELEIISDGKRAVIKPMTADRVSLGSLLAGVTAKNIHDECDWGEPVGKEVW